MKKNLFIAGLILITLTSFGQDAKVILKQSYDKCQSVQNGYYEMTRRMKYMSGQDTTTSIFYCNFRKLPEDSIFSSAFHYYIFGQDSSKFEALYTGDDFVTASSKDSSATIKSKSLWAHKIKAYAHNYEFYDPLTDKESSPMKHDSDFIDNKLIYQLIGEENVNGSKSYHIQVNEIPENDSTEMMQALRLEHHYWISKEDFMPIQYSTAYDMVMNNDTMYQYEIHKLNKYEINQLTDENILTLNSIPSFYRMKDYVAYKSPELLKIDSIAPDWELPSLTDEKISLKSLQGQLVLVDFFYKSCYPCMQALPALQALNEKYKNNGLRVIGIDPYDKKEDGISAFLSKRGVTYTVLLEGKNAATDYHVSGYPTMYLIDRTGKILFIQEGYGKDTEVTLDEIIKKNL